MTKPVCAPPGKWDQRIERARELAGRYPFAAEVLTFYSKLAAFQQGSYSRLLSTLGSTTAGARNGQLPPELNPHELEALMPQFQPFLSFLMREGPSALAGFAASLKKSDPGDCPQLLMRFWRRDERDRKESAEADEGLGEPVRPETGAGPSDRSGLGRFTALAFLQPYAEYLADRAAMPPPPAARLSVLWIETLGRRSATGGRWRQTVARLLVLLHGVGLSSNRVPGVRRVPR